MAWHSFLPKLTVPKKVVFENGKLNALWYFLHLPLIGYATILFAVQKQYSEVISNSPFLMVNVDPLDAMPYMFGAVSNVSEDPSILSWCAAAGGPYLCDSNAVIQAACVELLTESILSAVPGLSMLSFCTRLCDLDKLDALDCLVPPSLFRPQGSTSLQITTYTAFNQGLFTGGNRNILVHLHPLLRFAPVTFSYSFQMSRSAPYFFGTNPGIAERKTGADAYTVAVTSEEKVLMIFTPGERVIIPPPSIVALAGLPWDATVMLAGGEFYAVVNCYTDGFDLPTALDWSGHSTLEPSPEIPVCLLTVDQLRPASGYKMADTLSDMAQAAAQIRVDTGRGDSFHRLPSLSAIVLNLISLVVLLKFPTILTIVFATNCLGSLSNVYKRAHQETMDISTRVAQLALRLLSDTTILGQLVDPKTGTGVSKAKLKEQLCIILQKVVPSKEEHEILAEDLSEHIFKTLRKMPQGHKNLEEEMAHGSHLANLMSIGQTVNVQDLCAYFDTSRRRSWLEWFTLPSSQRKLLRERRKLAKQLASLEASKQDDTVEPEPSDIKAQASSLSRLSAASSQSEVCVEVSDGEHLLEVQALQNEIDLLIGQVRTIKERQTEEDREEQRQQEVEERVQHLYVAVENLLQKIDGIEADDAADVSRAGLATLKKGTQDLEARVLQFEEENVRLSDQIQALHDWADARQTEAVKELEKETKATVAISSAVGREETRETAGREETPVSAVRAVSPVRAVRASPLRMQQERT